MNVCIVGLGYVGLPTAALIATKGLRVRGVDIDPEIVGGINDGSLDFQEPDLDLLVRAAVNSGNLTAHDCPAPADVYLLALPTPIGPDRQPDLGALEAAARALAPHLTADSLVIIESTIPVGTTAAVANIVHGMRPDLASAPGGVSFAHCPERVLPGQILRELVVNDRIVGGLDENAARRAEAFYRTFVTGRIHLTDAKTAELAKLAENAFRDVNIAFANELANVCDDHGIDVWDVVDLANHHPRVNVLKPGPGVGGHCIAVDPWFIVAGAKEKTPLIRSARTVNDERPVRVVEQVRAALKQRPGAVVACLGLAYKANVDDLRESPAMAVVEALAGQGDTTMRVVEPNVSSLPAALGAYDAVTLTDLASALDEAEIVVLLVDHDSFASVDTKALSGKLVSDTRGVWRSPAARG